MRFGEPGTLRVAPAEMIVHPLPLIEPPLQSIWFNTVTFWLPLNVPLLMVTNAGDTTPLPLKFAVPPERTSVLLVLM